MEFDLQNPLSTISEQENNNNPVLFFAESQQIPSKLFLARLKTDAFLVSSRRNVVSANLQAYCSGKFDQSVSYLAVNYMDRFISSSPKFMLGKPWTWRLLNVACVSLAAKMKNSECSPSHFQLEDGLIFDTKTIQRMELIVLDALNWRMRSITPFAFTEFFTSRFELDDPSMKQAIKDRAEHIIFNSQKETKLLEFKPSETAAAAILIAASHELLPPRFLSLERSIFTCELLNKENALRCVGLMQEMIGMEGCGWMMKETDVLSTRTPLNVLDWRFAGSEKETDDETPEKTQIKRRRTNNNVPMRLGFISRGNKF